MILDTVEYSIAEQFTSPQGEGLFSGVLMKFIRLAGCNVGKFVAPAQLQDAQLGELRVLYDQHSICTTVFGQRFLCDTDYHKRGTRTVKELLDTDAKHICITGGEPFMYDLLPLCQKAHDLGIYPHIETSGTKPIPPEVGRMAWITCSPKEGFLPTNKIYIDEWKFVVDPQTPQQADTLVSQIKELVGNGFDRHPVYIQPVNDVEHVDGAAVERLLSMQQRDSRLRISVQLHKYLRVR